MHYVLILEHFKCTRTCTGLRTDSNYYANE